MAAEMQSSFSGGRWVWWVDQLYRAVPNLNSYFDGVSVHPYGHDIRGRSPAITGHAYNGYQQMRRIELIRGQFVHHGAANKPFWATEVGWPTCSHGSSRCVSTAGQAASLRAIRALLADDLEVVHARRVRLLLRRRAWIDSRFRTTTTA